jgi:hypothetical protein
MKTFIRSFIHLFICSFVHLFICSFVHLFICSFVHLFICSFYHSIIHSFIHSFIHSSVEKNPRRNGGHCTTSEEEPSTNFPLDATFSLDQTTVDRTSTDRMTSTPPSPSPSSSIIPEKEVYDIELTKDENGLGITVAGYVCEKGG